MPNNVFVLSTGRCGSTTFTHACQHITNYTAGHETRKKEVGVKRLAYPSRHIEADNRLSWFLGRLDHKFGDGAFYVHLVRDDDATARSYAKRLFDHGIIMGYYRNILESDQDIIPNEDEWVRIAKDYCVTVNSNIKLFLKDKQHKMTIHLDRVHEEFPDFLEAIGAHGNLDAAMAEWSVRYNKTDSESALPHRFRHRVRRKMERIVKIVKS